MKNLNGFTLIYINEFYARLNNAKIKGFAAYHIMALGVGSNTAQKAMSNKLGNTTFETLSKIEKAIEKFNGENDD